MANNSVTFGDGFTVSIGDQVRFDTRHGSHGTGTVIGFGRQFGRTTILIDPDYDTCYGDLDKYTLTAGGTWNRLTSVGVAGGEIVR